jgi:ubiquinol-cytochrome c reductase cytochrome c1 subunit
MKSLTKLIIAVAALVSGAAMAAGGGVFYPHDAVDIDASKKSSLQNGAKFYVNYCLGCHSMKYQRFQRIADDLEMPTEVVESNLMFTTNKIGEQMRITMPAKDAGRWFGTPPPDLSLITRSRSPKWVYNYLRAFYLDDSRPWGVNNTVFPSVGMPHVLAELQGEQVKSKEFLAIEARIEAATAAKNEAVAKNDSDAKSKAATALHFANLDKAELAEAGKLFSIAKAGEMTPEEYDVAIADLTNFLAYVADPVKDKREAIGIWVMAFLVFLFFMAYILKKEYWRDIH